MLPQFNENSVITLPIHMNTNVPSKYHKYDVILGLDAIIELGIIIDGFHKTIIWENMTIPIKQIQYFSYQNNETKNGRPSFIAIQPFEHAMVKNTLNQKIQTKMEDRNKKISSKSFRFLDHCLLYLGLFNSLFNNHSITNINNNIMNNNLLLKYNQTPEFNYQPDNDIFLDNWYNQEYIDKIDEDINFWW